MKIGKAGHADAFRGRIIPDFGLILAVNPDNGHLAPSTTHEHTHPPLILFLLPILLKIRGRKSFDHRLPLAFLLSSFHGHVLDIVVVGRFSCFGLRRFGTRPHFV